MKIEWKNYYFIILFFGSIFVLNVRLDAFVSGEIDFSNQNLGNGRSFFQQFRDKAELFKKEVGRFTHGLETSEEYTARWQSPMRDPLKLSELRFKAQDLKQEAEIILNQLNKEQNGLELEEQKEYIDDFLVYLESYLGVKNEAKE